MKTFKKVQDIIIGFSYKKHKIMSLESAISLLYKFGTEGLNHQTIKETQRCLAIF